MLKYLLLLFLFAGLNAKAQENPDIKFGKISVADLSNKIYPIDTAAPAVILAQIGSTQIKGNDKGSVSLEFKLYQRVHILKRTGFDHATFEIRLYKQDDDEEKLKDLKAVTYNLENGKVVETKLAVKSSVYEEKIDRNSRIRKFTLPNVKEGSIIEIEYKLVSDFLFNLQPWEFQGDIPRLWSEYSVSIPQFLEYVLVEQGSLPFHIRDQKSKQGNYVVQIPKEVYGGQMTTERFDISCAVTDFRWVQKNVPAFVRDHYMSSPANYLSRLEFQLAGFLPPFMERKIMTSWQGLTRDLLARSDFGGQLETATYWMPEMQQKILKSATTEMEKAKKIFEYVRDNFTCIGYNQLFADEKLDKVLDKKRGGVAELNLLLTCLLRGAGFQADPVILSTRGHGRVNNEYPVFSPFNYVICRLQMGGKPWLLDASRPLLGFGKLTADCYNGTARVVNAAAEAVNLNALDHLEKNQTAIFVFNDPGGKWTAKVKKTVGYMESLKTRYQMAKDGLPAVQQELTGKIAAELTLDSLRLDSLTSLESPVVEEFLLKGAYPSEDVIYINPVLISNYRQNPFKSANRKYPVEIPFRENELYTANIQLPAGYVVEELPKAMILRFDNKTDIQFQYSCTKSDNAITVNYNLEINRTDYAPEEYEMLRTFFAAMIAKLQEPVVCKRK